MNNSPRRGPALVPPMPGFAGRPFPARSVAFIARTSIFHDTMVRALTKKQRWLLGHVIVLVASVLAVAVMVSWLAYVPTVISAATAQRLYPPAMTVSASLMIAASLSGSVVITRTDPKYLIADLFLYSFAFAALTIALLASVWGLLSGGSDPGLDLGVVILVPLAWLWGCIALLSAIVYSFIYRPD